MCLFVLIKILSGRANTLDVKGSFFMSVFMSMILHPLIAAFISFLCQPGSEGTKMNITLCPLRCSQFKRNKYFQLEYSVVGGNRDLG